MPGRPRAVGFAPEVDAERVTREQTKATATQLARAEPGGGRSLQVLELASSWGKNSFRDVSLTKMESLD